MADTICDLRSRKIKTIFFAQINGLIDWDRIEKLIDADYSKGKSAVGKPSHSGLLLFKMCLLQSWYGLSDYEVEDRLNDSISFGYFCGMHMDEVAPDHSTLSRFRTALTKTGTFERLFGFINAQLEAHNIIVKEGIIVDASVVETPFRPKGKTDHRITEDHSEEEVVVKKVYAESVDNDGTWPKKRGKYHFGFKKHHVTDDEGIVLGALTTTAEQKRDCKSGGSAGNSEHRSAKGHPVKGRQGLPIKEKCGTVETTKLKGPYPEKSVQKQAFDPLEKEIQQTHRLIWRANEQKLEKPLFTRLKKRLLSNDADFYKAINYVDSIVTGGIN